MSDNLRRRTDEGDIGWGHSATDAWPYLMHKLKEGTEPRWLLAFMLIDDMPTIVLGKDADENGGDATIMWYGFYKGQWYTDFEVVPLAEDMEQRELDLQAAVARALVKAEELLENDLHEPKSATVEAEAPTGETK